MEKAQVTGRQFVGARKDPPEMLELVDETQQKKPPNSLLLTHIARRIKEI
jgi:hypothetical protein